MDKETERIKREIFSKPKEVTQEQPGIPTGTEHQEINPELLKMFPPERLERIKRKELRKYAAAQDKKWKKYLESVNK